MLPSESQRWHEYVTELPHWLQQVHKTLCLQQTVVCQKDQEEPTLFVAEYLLWLLNKR